VGFVLVPVPAEHVLEIMRWVLFRADEGSAGESGVDVARVTALASEAEPEIRRLLELVAVATIKNEPLRLRDLADELGRETAEVSEVIEVLNATTLDGDRELIEVRSETAVGVTGQRGTIAFVAMRVDLARAARLAVRRQVAG